MITICHLTRSRSERIVWLMEELGLEYKLEVYPREPTGAAPAQMRDIHAIGRLANAPSASMVDSLMNSSEFQGYTCCAIEYSVTFRESQRWEMAGLIVRL